jgi:hypothetical protein
MCPARNPQEPAGRPLRFASEYPNFPEVSGTTLPLLTTVLAGFAVTIIVQIMVRGDTSESLPARVTVALLAFLVSTLLLLSSTTFAINAQAHNYLPFMEPRPGSGNLLAIDDHEAWIRRLERRWHIYHVAALGTFYAGVILLLAGLNIVVWVYAGRTIALVFLGVVVLNLAIVLGIGLWASRREEDRAGRGDAPVA